MFVNVPKKLERYLLETKIGAPATLALCVGRWWTRGTAAHHKHAADASPTPASGLCRVAGIDERHPSPCRLGRWAFPLAAPPTAKILAVFPLVFDWDGDGSRVVHHPIVWPGILIGAMVPYSTIETGGLALAFSAGLYEELVFRLLLIEAGAHMSITFLGTSRINAMPYLIGLSGVLFACYHAPLLEGFDMTGLMVYTFGGIWLAVLYRYRGTGHCGIDPRLL